jgi:hypothetical protein
VLSSYTLTFIPFTIQSSHNTLLFFGFLNRNYFFLDKFLLVPASQVVNYLRMIVKKIISLQVLLVPTFDSFEQVIMRIEVVAGLEVGILWEFDFFVLVFLEEEVKH